jgi:hypothetical protein
MPIHLIRNHSTPAEVAAMLEEFREARMIKIVVDVRRRLVAGGGGMHADCEQSLLDAGSEQDDLWGANWFPDDQSIEFESLINIRPRLGNRSIVIQSAELRAAVEDVARERLGGVTP